MMVELDETTYVRADTVLRIEKAFDYGVIVFTNDGRKHQVRPKYEGQPPDRLAYQLAATINQGLAP